MNCEECSKTIEKEEGHYLYLGFKFCENCWSNKSTYWQETAIKQLMGQSVKILSIDDDGMHNKIIEKCFKGHGGCTIVKSGKEGIAQYQEAINANDPFDLICLDIMMPEMSGVTVLQVIRKYEEEKKLSPCKIVIISTLFEHEEFVPKLPEGVEYDGYMQKPICVERLDKIIVDFEKSKFSSES